MFNVHGLANWHACAISVDSAVLALVDYGVMRAGIVVNDRERAVRQDGASDRRLEQFCWMSV